MGAAVSSSGSCIRCDKELTAPAANAGLCHECLLSTGADGGTLNINVDAERTRTAVVQDDAATVTHDPRETLVYDDRPRPVSSARAAKLASAHGLIDVVRMPTAGGMGELYRAYDPAAARAVVIKFVRLDTRLITNLGRFLTEARSLARVQHENVARLFCFIEAGDPYFIMEDVAGGSLTDLLEAGPLTGLDAARLIAAAARGVAAAHREGVIHRDLKPGNILLSVKSVEATPKVADFGIAKDLDAVEPQTNTYALIGTPGYMSPEQADWRASECDARSDVWGLAATLYCCITGSPPFDRHLRPEAILKQPLIPAIVRRPELSPELNAIICKGLEKEPADRYQTADAFADDLGRFLVGLPVLARPRAWPVRLWRRAQHISKVVAASILVALLAMGALSAVMISDRKPNVVPEPTAEQKVEKLMAELKEGKTVTLVPETGLPVWSKFVAGHPTVDLPESLSGATGITSFGDSVVQISPNLPIPAYTVDFELRDVAGINVPGPGRAHHEFGTIVGMTEALTISGKLLPFGYEVTWCDFDRELAFGRPNCDEYAKFGHNAYWEEEPLIHGLGSIAFKPSRTAAKPGIWRPVRFNVAPDRVDASWQLDNGMWKVFAVVDADKLKKMVAEAMSSLGGACKPAGPLPDWSSERALGIRCNRATVGVRKVIVTPRPNS